MYNFFKFFDKLLGRFDFKLFSDHEQTSFLNHESGRAAKKLELKRFRQGIFQRTYIITLGCVLLLACQEQPVESTPEKSLKEIKIEKGSISNADIIRNPVTADRPVDTTNVAKMAFDNVRYKYGEVAAGEIVTHTFKFKNVGKAPLIISNAKSTCGCTVPEWPKEPIPAGGTGEIHVKFDTKNKDAFQTKPIFLTANTHPSETTLYLMGKVRGEKSGSRQ